MNTGGGGASGGAGGMVAAGKPQWCSDPKFRILATQGIHKSDAAMMSTQTMDPAGVKPPGTPDGMAIGAGVNYTNGYKTGTYDTAKDGEVALLVLMGGFEGLLQPFTQQLDRLSFLREFPPTIVVATAAFNGGSADAADKWKAMFADLKAKFPKLSDKPEYHAVTGGSTPGAAAFDFIWDNTDLASKALVGSGSYVCFMPKASGTNNGYVDLIKTTTPAKPIRVAGTVGACDIFPSIEERVAAMCSATTDGGSVDSSACAANWQDVNKAVTQAMLDKNIAAQLIITPSGHEPLLTWVAPAVLKDRLRFLFADITCK
jgi:hypothetical protein